MNNLPPLTIKIAKEDPTKVMPRAPVFRKNLDLGQGYERALDEYRSGKIKGMHDFIEERREEPSPVDGWKAKRKKRKKKVSQSLPPLSVIGA